MSEIVPPAAGSLLPVSYSEFPGAPDYFASNPRRSFIRVLWGKDGPGSRQPKVLWDVTRFQLRPEVASCNPPVMCYVFGRDNYDFLRSKTFHCKLLSENPRPFAVNDDAGDHAWTHKIEGWRAALADFPDGIIHMDWDVLPLQRINIARVFGGLAAKSDFGANLLQYRQIVSPWRRRYDRRKKPSAAFVYLGNAAVGESIAAAFKHTCEVMRLPCGTEEGAMSWYVDQRHGGWPGLEGWCKTHETFCCVVPKCWGVPKEMGFQKEPLFTYGYV